MTVGNAGHPAGTHLWVRVRRVPLHAPLFKLEWNWGAVAVDGLLHPQAAIGTGNSMTWTIAYFLVEWLVRLVMLFYVPQKRAPADARSWLLLIFIFPLPGLLLYAFLGRVSWPRKRKKLRERVSLRIRETCRDFTEKHGLQPNLPPHFQSAVTLAKKLGDFDILGGNRLELLDDYDRAIDRLVADIDTATSHVHLLYYIFAVDETGQRVADALLRAARRGVACRILLDAIGSGPALKQLAPTLRAAGIEVVALLPVSFFRRDSTRLDMRNHRKIVVVDGRIAHVGSQNIINARVDEDVVNEEVVARVAGPVVLQLQAVFLTDRFLDTEQNLSGADILPDLAPQGMSPAQVLPSGPGYLTESNQRLIVALLHAAQRNVVITTAYFIPDGALLQAIEAAVQRGVEVHLIASQKSDHMLVALAMRSYYEDLLEAGVSIHLYRGRFLHAKHMSIDDTVALIGSSNMDIRSFRLNSEVTLIVYDPQVASQLRVIQERYMAAAERLELADWQNRPYLPKVVQHIARLIDAVL